MIVLDRISLQRGGAPLLDAASLTIQPGRRVGVVGRNGSGKSTLFALLRGTLHVDGGELAVPPTWRIAHMEQEVGNLERSALDHVLDGDHELRRIEAELAAAETSGDGERLGHAYADYEAHDGYTARSRAERLLHGLGFGSDEVERAVADFSGGWRIRISLARALMQPSDLLLLDEPTNHLDLDAIYWLEQQLVQYPGTLLVISHDRDFLDNVADTIVHIEHHRCFSYRGDYSAFELQRAEALMQQQAMFDKQQRRVAEIHSFVTRFRAKASKARQAQSRLKELERMERIAPAHADAPFHFIFRPAPASSDPLLVLRDAAVGYSGTTLVAGINLHLGPGSRIGLLGPNGAGKSTLLKSLVGDLPLQAGQRTPGEHLRIGYFTQHQMEVLDPQASPLLHLQRLDARASEQELRNFLGGFDFQGDRALAPVAPFSGGEKARLALALIVWQRPNLLLLDEPTNHLDLEMRHALTVALQGFEGALVVVAHDRHLLRNTVDEYWCVHGGIAAPFDGDLDDYHRWIGEQSGAAGSPNPAAAVAPERRKEQRREAAAARQRLAPLRKELQRLEKALEKAGVERAEVETALADPALYADAANRDRLAELLQRQGELRRSVEATEAAWMEAGEALQQAEAESA